MNKEVVESFVSIVRHQTISAAAKTLFVSQSTVSHRIQMLEQELCVTLFNRERGFKKMELTEDGEKFYPLALQWLELNEQMHQIHSQFALGKIQIGSMDSINQLLLPPIISKIREELPDLQMEFVSYHSQEIYSRLTSQLLDVGFAFYPIHYDILATPVFSEPMYMMCLPGSIYPDGPVHPSQLDKSNQIYFTWDENIMRWNSEWWDERQPPYVKVDSCGLLTTFLKTPANWVICPASVATSYKAQFNTEIHPFTVSPPNRICYMLRRKYPRGRAQSKGTEAFISAFNTLLEKHPWRYTSTT